MLRISGKHGIVLVAVFVFLFCSSIKAEQKDSGKLVWSELLEHAKLKIVWENELPLNKAESLKKIFIAGDCLYCFSNKNYIVSLNMADGSFVFGRSYAPSGFPIVGFKVYEDTVFSVIGNELIEMQARTGTESSRVRLDFGVSCAASRNSSHFYIGGVDRRVHVLEAEDKIKIFKASADNDSAISSVVAGEDIVIFGTDAGNVIAIASDEARRLWQVDTYSAIAGSLVLDGDSVFVAGKDTNVYRIDIYSGKPVWKYQTEAMLDREPTVTKTAVYQYVWGKGLTAIDRTSGQHMWDMPGGLELLAEEEGRAYVITENETLVVMDNNKAKQLYSVNFAGVSRYVANVADSRIYIADESGRIACLEPIE
ncbi:PQQ-binding-like beta-propeller repeat protein [Planctomycetota bacterium]